MLPILSLLLVLGISLLVTRIATVALVHTGMGRESARFQARSAFSGVGFTTTEAESILGHPVRRQIVMWLMLVGNVGIVTAMASLMLSVFDLSGMGHDGADSRWRLGVPVLAGGVGLLLFASSSAWVDRGLARIISWALRRFTRLDARDYANLLHLRDDYGVTELCVKPGDWIADKTLGESRLAGEGVLVLGVSCPGNHFLGAPSVATEIRPGDTLIVYGRDENIAALDTRTADLGGDSFHAEAVQQQALLSRDEHDRAGR